MHYSTRSASSTELDSEEISLKNLSTQLSRTSSILFLIFAVYLVIPIIDVPFLGLSLSAPILFLVFLDMAFRLRQPLGDYRIWIGVAYFILFGLLLSLTGNAVFRGGEIEAQDLLTLVRYSYWIIAFLTTLIIVSSSDNMLKSIVIAAAIAILLLAGLRLYEASVFGRWGAWTSPQLMTQNSYGIQFSTFFPFALSMVFAAQGRKRYLFLIALILVIVAIAGNGSRSSWIAVITGSALFLLLLALAQRGGVILIQTRLVALIAATLILVAITPPEVLDPVISRLDTFESLDADKSYQVRQIMIQKGLRLFEDSPIYGYGIGRFTRSSVPLEIPDLLSYHQQDWFDNKSSHNSYMAFLGETGLVGVIPFAALHIMLFVKGIPAAFALVRQGQVWGLAVFSGYVGMSLHLWSLAGLTGTAPWFVYGLVAGMIEYERRNRAARSSGSP